MLLIALNRHRFDIHLRSCVAMLVLIALVGCQSKEGISTYYTETESPAVRTTVADEAAVNQGLPRTSQQSTAARQNRGKPTDRMIAVIVPTENQAWFLKVVGPIAKVNSREKAILDFFAEVEVNAEEPAWDLPKDWQVGSEKTMRLATLLIPTTNADTPTPESEPLELSIIGLPLTGDWSSQVLSNVNRWRKQLGRDPLTISLLEEMTTPIEITDGSILFDSTGWFDDGGMSSGGGAPFAPFATSESSGRDKSSTPTKSPPAATPKPMQSSSNTMASAPAVPVGSGNLKHTPPEGWTNLPGSAMRKASLSTPDGATVTAFVFPATAPAMADPLANVNRWRGEVGLGPTTDDALAKSSQELSLAGGMATYVELVGETETTLAAMTPRGDQVWFFKLRGLNAAAEAQRDAFKQWLASIEL